VNQDIFHFNVTGLNVAIEEGFKLKWQGREIDSGRVTVSLGEPGSRGVIDYGTGSVKVDFRVRIMLPELSELLTDIGADPDIAAPVIAVIHSEGAVLDDHCFRLAGKAELAEHRLFNEETKVEILAPTRCKPDKVSMSGDEIRKALRGGQPVSWNFNPAEKRVVLVLPEALGGYTHLLCLSGRYEFTAACPKDAASSQGAEPRQEVAA
jgi:hypothetical protein